MGLVEAMTAAKDREIRGVGMQNFKYNTDYREFMALVNTISSRASRTISQEFKVETPCSMKYVFNPQLARVLKHDPGDKRQQNHDFPLEYRIVPLNLRSNTATSISILMTSLWDCPLMIQRYLPPCSHYMIKELAKKANGISLGVLMKTPRFAFQILKHLRHFSMIKQFRKQQRYYFEH